MSLLQHLRQWWPVAVALLAKLAAFELPSVNAYAANNPGKTFAAILVLVVVALSKEQPAAIKWLAGKPTLPNQKGFIRFSQVATVFLLCFAITFVPAVMVGCTEAQVASDVQKVIQDMPTIISIVTSILQIVPLVTAAPPNLNADVTTYENKAVAGLNTIQQGLTAYESNLANMPPSVIGQIDSAVQVVQQNLSQIESEFNVTNPTAIAAIGVAVASVNTFLLGVTSLIPASALAAAPYSQHLRAAVGSPSGAHYIVPSRRELAKDYNAKIGKIAPKAKVHVPWVHLGPLPVLP
jgi:hypothetical protein